MTTDSLMIQPNDTTPLNGEWRYNNGFLCCGGLRIAKEDFDTDPNKQFKNNLFKWICDTLNSEQESHCSLIDK